MKRINQLDKLNKEVLKDNVKIRIFILCALAACTIGVLVWSVIKIDVIGFILDVILLGGFIFYLTCNIIIMPIENRRYKYRTLTKEDIDEINAYINLLEGEKSNVSKREYLLEVLQKNEEYLERERIRKEKYDKGEALVFTLEELELFAKEKPSIDDMKRELDLAVLVGAEKSAEQNTEIDKTPKQALFDGNTDDIAAPCDDSKEIKNNKPKKSTRKKTADKTTPEEVKPDSDTKSDSSSEL